MRKSVKNMAIYVPLFFVQLFQVQCTLLKCLIFKTSIQRTVSVVTFYVVPADKTESKLQHAVIFSKVNGYKLDNWKTQLYLLRRTVFVTKFRPNSLLSIYNHEYTGCSRFYLIFFIHFCSTPFCPNTCINFLPFSCLVSIINHACRLDWEQASLSTKFKPQYT